MIDEKILEEFNGKKILVTGGTGLIGRELLLVLRDCGAEITSVSLDRLQPVDGIDYKLADLSNLDTCLSLTKNKNYVFHVAGIKGSVEVTKLKPASFFVNLLMMNTNVLESCRVNEVEKVVYTSSVGAYSSAEVFREDCNREGPPMDEFPGLAKRMAEKQVEAYKIQYGLENFAIVRPANCFSSDTNVLTPEGVKKITDFSVGDFVYTLNTSNFDVEIDTVVNCVRQRSNKIISFKGRTIDWKVSPDHNLFLKTNNSNYRFVSAEDLLNSPSTRNLANHNPIKHSVSNARFDLYNWIDENHLICFYRNQENKGINTGLSTLGMKKVNGKKLHYAAKKSFVEKNIPDLDEFLSKHKCSCFVKDHPTGSNYSPLRVPIEYFIKILAWYIAEGNISEVSKNSFQVVLSQQNKENREEMINDVKLAGFKPSIGIKSIAFTSRMFSNYIRDLGLIFSENKSVPKFIFNLDISLRRLFFETLMKGDGHSDGSRYTTKSKQLAEDVFHLVFTLGGQPLLRKYTRENCYRVLFRRERKNKSIKPHNISAEESHEDVFCITAKKNHIIFAGRNGFMGWIGQCFGPGDNFDPNNAMVIPSLMHRIRSGEDPVIIWGDGSAIRDFGYSGDIAEGIILALHHGTGGDFVNLGSGEGVSIKELVETLNSIVDFNYEFNGKSGGFPKRVMDISLAKEKLGYEPSTSLSEGLTKTWEWFLENSDEYLNRKNYFIKGS